MARLALAILLLAACRTAPPPTLPQREAATMSESSGKVAVQLVPDPGAPAVSLGPDEEYVEPHLWPSNPLPEYPRELVPRALPPHTVVLRVTFDETGRAIDAVRSPIGEATESEHRPAFEEAARQAMQQWRCTPAQIRKFRPGPDADKDGKPDFTILAARRALKAFFDVAFVFEVVNGVPVVKRSGSH